MGEQIVDATLVPAPKQRNTDDEKAAIQAGKSASEIWPEKPAKAAQKGTQAWWTVKNRPVQETRRCATRMPDIAIPVFGYPADS